MGYLTKLGVSTFDPVVFHLAVEMLLAGGALLLLSMGLGLASLLELLLRGVAVAALLLMGLAVIFLTQRFQVDLLLSVAASLVHELSFSGSGFAFKLKGPARKS